MRQVKMVCGCGVEIERRSFDDNVHEFTGVKSFVGLCLVCDENDRLGKGYNHSPHWRETPVGPSSKTLAFLNKRRAERAEEQFKEEFGDKPMHFGKKKRRA